MMPRYQLDDNRVIQSFKNLLPKSKRLEKITKFQRCSILVIKKILLFNTAPCRHSIPHTAPQGSKGKQIQANQLHTTKHITQQDTQKPQSTDCQS